MAKTRNRLKNGSKTDRTWNHISLIQTDIQTTFVTGSKSAVEISECYMHFLGVPLIITPPMHMYM